MHPCLGHNLSTVHFCITLEIIQLSDSRKMQGCAHHHKWLNYKLLTTASYIFWNTLEVAALECSCAYSVNLKTQTSKRASVYSSSTRNLCNLSFAEVVFLITLLKTRKTTPILFLYWDSNSPSINLERPYVTTNTTHCTNTQDLLGTYKDKVQMLHV